MMTWPRLWSGEETVISERHTLKSIPSKILLPIDFSPSPQAAFETAADLAFLSHAELFLVNALPFFSTLRSEYAFSQVQFQQMGKNARRAAAYEGASGSHERRRQGSFQCRSRE